MTLLVLIWRRRIFKLIRLQTTGSNSVDYLKIDYWPSKMSLKQYVEDLLVKNLSVPSSSPSSKMFWNAWESATSPKYST